MGFDQSDSYFDNAQLTYKCSECYVEFDDLEEVRCHQKTCSQTWVYEAVERREDSILSPAIKSELNEQNDSPSNVIRDENLLQRDSMERGTKTINPGNEKEPSKVASRPISYKHQNVTIIYGNVSKKLINSYLSHRSITTKPSQPASSIDPYEFVDDEVEQSVPLNPKLFRRKTGKKPKTLTSKPHCAASPKSRKKNPFPRKSGQKTGKTRLMRMEKLIGITSKNVRDPTNTTLYPVNTIIPSNGKDSGRLSNGVAVTSKDDSISVNARSEQPILVTTRSINMTKPESINERRKSRCNSKETEQDSTNKQSSVAMHLTEPPKGPEVVQVLDKDPEKLLVKRGMDVTNPDTSKRKRSDCKAVDKDAKTETKTVELKKSDEIIVNNQPELSNSLPDKFLIPKSRKAKINRVNILDKEVIIRLQGGANEDTSEDIHASKTDNGCTIASKKTNECQETSGTINVNKACTDNDLGKSINNSKDSRNVGVSIKCNSTDQKPEKQLMVKLPNIRQFSNSDSLKEQSPGLAVKDLDDKKKLSVVIKLERLNHCKLSKATLKRKTSHNRKGSAN